MLNANVARSPMEENALNVFNLEDWYGKVCAQKYELLTWYGAKNCVKAARWHGYVEWEIS